MTKTVNLSVEAPKVERSITVPVTNPETIQEAVKAFGEAIVLDMMQDALDVRRQAFIRGLLSKDGDKRLSDAQVKAKFAEWKPGQRKAADPAKKMEMAKKLLGGLDEATRAALLASLNSAKPTLVKGAKR